MDNLLNIITRKEITIPIKVILLFFGLKPEPEKHVIIDVLHRCLSKCEKNDNKKLFFSLSLCEVYRKFNHPQIDKERTNARKINNVAFDNYLKLVELYIKKEVANIPTDKGYVFSTRYEDMAYSDLIGGFGDFRNSFSIVVSKLLSELNINDLSDEEWLFVYEVSFRDIIKSNFSDEISKEIFCQQKN